MSYCYTSNLGQPNKGETKMPYEISRKLWIRKTVISYWAWKMEGYLCSLRVPFSLIQFNRSRIGPNCLLSTSTSSIQNTTLSHSKLHYLSSKNALTHIFAQLYFIAVNIIYSITRFKQAILRFYPSLCIFQNYGGLNPLYRDSIIWFQGIISSLILVLKTSKPFPTGL